MNLRPAYFWRWNDSPIPFTVRAPSSIAEKLADGVGRLNSLDDDERANVRAALDLLELEEQQIVFPWSGDA